MSEPNVPEKSDETLILDAYADLNSKIDYIKEESSRAKIHKAYVFAKEKHAGQTRRSGEPYITHPLEVAAILTNFKVDTATLVAAILHDVVEDTQVNLVDIEKEFGEDVQQLVDGLTKLGKIKFRSNQERMAENFRKMILAMAKDIRVILVKLSDRLHNMRTLMSLPLQKRLRIAQETLDIYAPLASRLGIYGIKSELEDLCLKETKYEIYKEISQNIDAKKKERETYINDVRDILETELQKYGFQNVKVYGRPKHFFSIYKKMIDRHLAFKDIHDLFAFRIIVDTVKDCYEVLGIVHSMWKPMPGRFKDYIAMPKANMYQSLHTTVIRPNGSPAEIQIRTADMHRVCEYGIAAHWRYKEKNPQIASEEIKKFSWLKQMMELQQDVKDPSEFMASVKLDLFEEEIFVFTPKGDVIQLALGATALDFAFAIHTDIGSRTVGSKVNGRITPLRHVLQSGDIVEVFTSNQQKPNKDWLNFVITSKARNKIRSFLRNEQRETSSRIGREILKHELSKKHLEFDKISIGSKRDDLVKFTKESSFEDLLIAIGYGKINAKDLIERFFIEPKKPKTKPKNTETPEGTPPPINRTGVLVSGLDNVLVTYGKCCNPLPGEEVVGFITRGRGVSVHQVDCARALDLDPARKIEVQWIHQEAEKPVHNVIIRIVTQERPGVLADVTMAISHCGANIKKAQVKISTDMMGVLDFEIALKNLMQLNKVIDTIEKIPDVVFVERRNNDRKRKR